MSVGVGSGGSDGLEFGGEVAASRRRILEDAYQWLDEHRRWPTYGELDHLADRHGVDDPLTVMRTLSPTLLQGVGPAGSPSLNQELSLSLRGLAAVASWNASATEDLRWFAASIQAAVALSDRSTPSEPVRFEGIAFLAPSFPHGIPEDLVIRLGLIWRAAGGSFWSGLDGAGVASWGAELNRQTIRKYRPVRDVPSLLEVEARRLDREAEEQASFVASPRLPGWPGASAATPTRSTTSSSAPEWVALLPDGFREAVATRIVEHPAEAITAGWIALADLIGSKTGLSLDGENLVNQAFGATPLLRLGPDTETGKNLHRGYADLMRGLARMRNTQAHRGRPPVTELHAAAVVMAMGECFQMVEQADGLT